MYVRAFVHLYPFLLLLPNDTQTNVSHLAPDGIDAFTSYDAITLLIYLFYIFQFTILFDFQLNYFFAFIHFRAADHVSNIIKKKKKNIHNNITWYWYWWLWLKHVAALFVIYSIRSKHKESETETDAPANHRINGFSHFKFEAHTVTITGTRRRAEIFFFFS